MAVKAKVRKKSGNLPADPLGQRFCERFHHPFKAIVAPVPEPGEDTDWTTLKYFLHAANAWAIYCDPNRILGYRFGTTASYAVIDLDEGGDHHPATNPDALPAIKAALEKIGFCRSVLLQSSNSSGLHIVLPLPEEVNTFGLACAISLALKDAGFLIRNGHIEVYPNPKPYSENKITDFRAIRCPLQVGSFLLNDDLQPISNDLAKFLDVLDVAAAQQDLTQLKRQIAHATKRHKKEKYNFKSTSDVDEWRADWEQIIAQGWTARGQTNDYLQVLVGYAVVFKGLSGQQLIDYAVETATLALGFTDYCGHQRDIADRVRDWFRCTENNKYYSEYASYPERLKKTFATTFEDAIKGNRTKTTNNIVKFDRRKDENYRRSLDAQLRIRQIVSRAEWDGTLPTGASDRARFLSAQSKERFGKTLSQTTLQKYLYLWHPKRHIPDPWVSGDENSSNSEPERVYRHLDAEPTHVGIGEAANPEPEGVYRHLPLMKVLVLPPASAAPQAQADAPDSTGSENLLKSSQSSESLTHKENKCCRIPGAVDSDDNFSLSVEPPEIDHAPRVAPLIEASTPAATAPDNLPTLPPLDHKQIAMFRIQALAHAQREVRVQALAQSRLYRGSERFHLEQAVRMRLYWQSGSELLRAEALSWAKANPGCIPEIDQFDPKQTELSPPAPLSPPSGPASHGARDTATAELTRPEDQTAQQPTNQITSTTLDLEPEPEPEPDLPLAAKPATLKEPIRPPLAERKNQPLNRQLQPIQILNKAGEWVGGYFVHLCIAVTNLAGQERQFTLFDANGETYVFFGQIRPL